MKNLVYLVQGRSDLIKNYFHLADRESADAIFLTYDKQIDDAVYYPDSTWSEGRNKLLEEAEKKGGYLYYIFCDDDIEFTNGGWDEYEYYLLKYRPAIGCPVFPKTKKTKIGFLDVQVFFVNDEQLMAFHRDVVKDRIVLPIQTHLDHLHWWACSRIQETVIQNFYQSCSLQFNNIQIINTEHGRYDTSGNSTFLEKTNKWLAGEFVNSYSKIIKPKNHTRWVKIKILFYTISFLIYKKLKPENFRISKKKILNSLKKDSVLLKQYSGING